MNWYKKSWGVVYYSLDSLREFQFYIERQGQEISVQIMADITGQVKAEPYLETREEGYEMRYQIEGIDIYIRPEAYYNDTPVELTIEELARAEEEVKETISENIEEYIGEEI